MTVWFAFFKGGFFFFFDVDRMISDYKVETVNDSMSEFFVEFKGPANSKFLLSNIVIRRKFNELGKIKNSGCF